AVGRHREALDRSDRQRDFVDDLAALEVALFHDRAARRVQMTGGTEHELVRARRPDRRHQRTYAAELKLHVTSRRLDGVGGFRDGVEQAVDATQLRRLIDRLEQLPRSDEGGARIGEPAARQARARDDELELTALERIIL